MLLQYYNVYVNNNQLKILAYENVVNLVVNGNTEKNVAKIILKVTPHLVKKVKQNQFSYMFLIFFPMNVVKKKIHINVNKIYKNKNNLN